MPKLLDTPGGRRAFWCPGCSCRHFITDAWVVTGGSDTLTVSPSIRTAGYVDGMPVGGRDGGQCHLFIHRGKIEFLPDSTHALAGQLVDLEDCP
jgi:hypothetical protein